MISAADLRRRIDAELDSLVAVRRDLHAHPELGYRERRTSAVVARELEGAGVAHLAGLAGGTGVVGHLEGRGDRAIGLRADMDALPIQEAGDVPWRSTIDGVMHACGHDGHTTILIGTARVLAGIARDQGLPRPVRFVFQPAEEGGAGAKRMIEDGCLAGESFGATVEMMFGLHGWPLWPQGVVGSRPGPLLAATDSFDIVVRGAECHAAFPTAGRDPIVAAAAVVTALQTLVAREVDPLDSAVISVTKIHGGDAYNVIPREVRLSGTLRTLRPETRTRLLERLGSLASGVAAAHRAEAALEVTDGYPVTLNDPHAVEIFERTARESIGEERVRPVPAPVMGGEDFSFYCHEVPSCFFVLGSARPGDPAPAQLHQAHFDFNDDIIATGVELFCRLALAHGVRP